MFKMMQKDGGCTFRVNRHKNRSTLYPGDIMPGHILKEELQRQPGANPLDDLGTSFSPGGHEDREQNGRKKGEPASIPDLEKIGQKVGHIKNKEKGNQRDCFPERPPPPSG